MSVLMKIVFSLSLSGSLLILILLLCGLWFKNKLSRQWQYYIWLIVIARLLLPVAPEVSVVGTLFSNANPVENQMYRSNPANAQMSDMPQVIPTEKDTVIQYQESGQNDGRTVVSEISVKNMMHSLLQNLWIPWLVIALLLLIRKVTIYQSFVKYIKSGRREVSDTTLLDRLAQIGEQAGVSRPVELYVNHLVSSPLLLGFIRPCIVLPTDDLPEADFKYTVWHELIHYKRKDIFYKWLVQITICLHWFNPLVWLMGWEINRACEFSCDEAVLGTLGEEERCAYGDTLLHALDTGGNYKDFPVSVTLSESVELLKERLSAIMIFKKSTKMATTISVVFAIALMLGATAAGAYVEPVRTIAVMDVVTVSTSDEKTENSMETLAERYYKEDMLIQFGAVYSALDESAQRMWLDTIYEEDDIRFFSIAVNSLDSSSPLIQEYAEKTYTDEDISYFSILINHMSADLLKSWQDRAAKDDMDISFRSVLLSDDETDLWIEKAEKEDREQYLKWGITKEEDDYYYQGRLVHLFYDKYDAETVIRTIHINPLGTIDLKVTRNIRNKIISVDYMTNEEVEELFDTDALTVLDCEEKSESWEKEAMAEGDVYRLTAEELPEDVTDKMLNCDINTWYVIHAGGRQYISCKRFAWSYAWQPVYNEDGWRIDVNRLEKKDYGSVLLSLPDNGPVKIYCDGQEVDYVETGE